MKLYQNIAFTVNKSTPDTPLFTKCKMLKIGYFGTRNFHDTLGPLVKVNRCSCLCMVVGTVLLCSLPILSRRIKQHRKRSYT